MSTAADKILDGFQLLAESFIQKAGYDKTIQAQIISCEDASIGKYKCRYQDAIIYAYATNIDVTYTKNAYVYILVPGNDMTKEKTILGTTDKLGINYINQMETQDLYDTIGCNCITESQKFYLDTNNQNYIYKIYPSEAVKIDINALEQYIKQSSSLMLGATFKTSIPSNRQYGGHYGIKFNLKFKDNAVNNQIIRTYIINEDNMVDNPYKLIYDTRQYQIFDIDGVNFTGIDSIEIFNKDFPNATGTESTGLLDEGDIEISNLEFFGAVKIDENELNGISISFYTPKGTFFTASSTDDETRPITAQVRIKGKLASSVQKISYYWGIENARITSKNEYYNKYLGRGWKCLNEKNISYDENIDNTEPIIEWIPATDTYQITRGDATARDNRLKVAIVYDGNIITKEITIQNLSPAAILTIQSDGGTDFYFDIGNPTLTCLVNGEQKTEETIEGIEYTYIYDWAYQDNQGIFYDLQSEFGNLIDKIDGYKITEIPIYKITNFGTFKCSVHKVRKTDKKEIYLGTCSITLRNILENQGNFSLVINNGNQVFKYDENGVAPNNATKEHPLQLPVLSFTLYNHLGQPINDEVKKQQVRWQFPIKDSMLIDINEKNDIINSGTDQHQNYKYYDNVSELAYDIESHYSISKQRNQIRLIINFKGQFLTAETDFTFLKQGDPGTNGTEYVIKIVPNTKMANPPKYPMVTEIITRIDNGNKSTLNYLDKISASYYLNYGVENENSSTKLGEYSYYDIEGKRKPINNNSSKQFFKVQIWRNGTKVWEGKNINEQNGVFFNDGSVEVISMRWEMLTIEYSATNIDKSVFNTITQSNDVTYSLGGSFQYLKKEQDAFYNTERKINVDTSIPLESGQRPFANIVKCTIIIDGKTYYSTLPITTAQIVNYQNNKTGQILYKNYNIKLKDYTGWRYATYTSDGMFPQYDNTYPFEFILTNQNGIDVSSNYKPTITSIGNFKKYEIKRDTNKNPILDTNNNYQYDFNTENSNLIEILKGSYRNGLKNNQTYARPASQYNGFSVNNSIVCEFKDSQDHRVAKIIVPIHFLLNRYGLSNINAWDGNTIQIDKDGGSILSPQVGAGTKNDDNSFTGIVMGQVKQPKRETSKIGLLGYNKGTQSLFLNSRNGSAIFGAGAGRIVIDPSAKKRNKETNQYETKGMALLYSSGYWKQYNEDGPNVGLPINYEENNRNNHGMLINLSEAEIKFGSGRFSVNSNGHIHAAGGGDIAGWVIGQAGIYSNIDSDKGRITISAGTLKNNVVTGPGKIYSHNHDTLTSAKTGFYLSYDGLSIGSKAKITNDGVMRLGNGAVSQYTGSHYWTINGDSERSYISYGGDTKYSTASSDINSTKKIYLGTDGITLGTRFSVTASGVLTAYSGKIGGWTITKNELSASGISLNSAGSISGGKFWKDQNKQYHDWTWNINKNGEATFNRLIASSSGKIGGWTIGPIYLKGDKLTLYNDGSIYGDNWSISSTGLAHFSKIHGQVANNYTFVGGGITMSGGGTGGASSVNPNTVNYGGGGGLSLNDGLYNDHKIKFDKIYAKQAEFENLIVNNSFTLGGTTVVWSNANTVVTKVENNYIDMPISVNPTTGIGSIRVCSGVSVYTSGSRFLTKG